MFEITMRDKKPVILYSDLAYNHYFSKEGYYRVSILDIDSSTMDRNYIIVYLYEMEEDAVYRAQIRTYEDKNYTESFPLQKMIELTIDEEDREEIVLHQIELEDLISLQFQVLVEKVNGYYNITKVFNKDEELGEFVSESGRLQANIKARFPNGIFTHKVGEQNYE